MATSPGPVPVPASTTSQEVLPANPGRNTLSVFNKSSGNCDLTYGPTSSPSAFTVQIGPGAYWEMQKGDDDRNSVDAYTGAISLIWESFTGGDLAMVTETTGA